MAERTVCLWKHTKSDGYSDWFKTGCGHTIRAERPVDVGFTLRPKAEELGPYCQFCGKKIKEA